MTSIGRKDASNAHDQKTQQGLKLNAQKHPHCAECNTLLLTNFFDLDRQVWVWCRQCGLVRDTEYSMGKTMKTLKKYMKKREIAIEDQRLVGDAFDAYGLRQARIMVGRVMNGEKFMSVKRTKQPDPWDEIGD